MNNACKLNAPNWAHSATYLTDAQEFSAIRANSKKSPADAGLFSIFHVTSVLRCARDESKKQSSNELESNCISRRAETGRTVVSDPRDAEV